jgi:hypothetical protein
MNKQQIREAILLRLGQDFHAALDISKQTRAEGSHSESRAENKYDTLSIEENYLADGLAKQAQGAALSASLIGTMPLRTFAMGEAIDVGALVEVMFSNVTEWYFLAPTAGGLDITIEGISVTVITPESPLGVCLTGARVGEEIKHLRAKVLRVE